MLRARYPPGYVGQIQLVTLLAGVVLEASRARPAGVCRGQVRLVTLLAGVELEASHAIPAGVCRANTIGYATSAQGFTIPRYTNTLVLLAGVVIEDSLDTRWVC